MTTAELKYGMVELITKVEDRASAEALFQLISDFLADEMEADDFEHNLNPAQVADLEASIAESYREENLISHEEVTQKYERWLQK